MKGWGIVAAVVVAVDAHAALTNSKTLSSTFRDTSREHPLLLGATTAYLVCHLFGVIPTAYDPLQNLGGNR